jgi:cytochrome c553
MKRFVGSLTLAFACVLAAGVAADSQGPPPWAFAVNAPGLQPASDDGTPKHVPGSTSSYTRTQIVDRFGVPDWYPDDHPPMPEAVAHGRKPDANACGFCHLPNGLGRPENASLAGLPATYIIQQVAEFRNGLRRSSDPRLVPVSLMIATAKGATDAEVKAAAEYFAALKPQPWIKVVETTDVPKTSVQGWMLVASDDGGREPIGQRIVETPDNLTRTELRDSRSGFVAYVPVGSIAKGEALVTGGGGGKTTQCGICHGAELRGLGPIPALAGRSPSYIVRQLYDFQHGARAGTWSPLMAGVVAGLSEDDTVAIAAYTASRTP